MLKVRNVKIEEILENSEINQLFSSIINDEAEVYFNDKRVSLEGCKNDNAKKIVKYYSSSYLQYLKDKLYIICQSLKEKAEGEKIMKIDNAEDTKLKMEKEFDFDNDISLIKTKDCITWVNPANLKFHLSTNGTDYEFDLNTEKGRKSLMEIVNNVVVENIFETAVKNITTPTDREEFRKLYKGEK